MNILAQFRDAPGSIGVGQFEVHLKRLWPVVEALASKDNRLANWYLTGDTEAEARLYPVFEAPGIPSTALLAVLSTRYEGSKRDRPKVFGFWNGHNDPMAGAQLKLSIDTGVMPSEIEIDLPDQVQGLGDCFAVEGVASVIARDYNPFYVSVAPRAYFEKQVFDDKPGVGWMLYLPKVITEQQVPEARALIPVPEASRKQVGTIIVSVADAVFSADNPEHVEVANRIEIRMVDQDLLPAYADL
ncbi:immunity 52 family protein [Burkholderia gladioli]|uniref:immunity 52 family protein n=1 Tax=Burkholderia gladioli TaxID=28095 RepID=UPI00163F1D9D|nr:immunity 52 family protein [Burkholderia gladioli]